MSTQTARRAVLYGLGPLFALALTQALQSGEQISLSQAISGIKHDFHTSDAVLGALPFAMAATGLLGTFPFGRLTDRSRRTTLLAMAMVSWTVFMGLAAMSVSLVMLFAMRMGLGAIEASSMAGVSLLGDYYPMEIRAKRIGQYTAGSLLGSIFALVVGGVAVQAWGWRAAFVMWLPVGLICAVFLARQPEPKRGDQDSDFGRELQARKLDASDQGGITLPGAIRESGLNYASMSTREVFRETTRIPTFWYATVALTIAGLLLNAAQFWGIEYFKRVHHLSNSGASGLAALLGAGSGIGILFSGVIADRLLRRGDLNARLHVGMAGCILGAVVLTPAWLIPSVWMSAPLFFFGGACLTLPIPATDAVLTDVVVAELRGRAIMVRSQARIFAYLGPLIVGGLSVIQSGGLGVALTMFTPVYALGAISLWRAQRHYGHDLAFVYAETERLRAVD